MTWKYLLNYDKLGHHLTIRNKELSYVICTDFTIQPIESVTPMDRKAKKKTIVSVQPTP